MFGINGFELFIIALFGFLLFGPDKLPAMAKTLGKAIAKFKDAQEEMNKVVREEIYNPDSDEPFKNPLDALSKVADIGKEEAKPAEKTESFSERKARYDRERALRRAAEREKLAEGTIGVSAAQLEKEAEEKQTVSADEVYGTKPRVDSDAKAESAVKAEAAAKTETASSDASAAEKDTPSQADANKEEKGE